MTNKPKGAPFPAPRAPEPRPAPNVQVELVREGGELIHVRISGDNDLGWMVESRNFANFSRGGFTLGTRVNGPEARPDVCDFVIEVEVEGGGHDLRMRYVDRATNRLLIQTFYEAESLADADVWLSQRLSELTLVND